MDYLTAIKNTHTNSVSISEINEVYTVLDKDGNSITIDQSLVDIEVARLQAEYDSQAYARSRKQEYDKLNQWEMQFDDNRDGTTTWVDSINEIKERFPK
jgi:uncharacterized protein YrzB (UPF0473 family)